MTVGLGARGSCAQEDFQGWQKQEMAETDFCHSDEVHGTEWGPEEKEQVEGTGFRMKQ